MTVWARPKAVSSVMYLQPLSNANRRQNTMESVKSTHQQQFLSGSALTWCSLSISWPAGPWDRSRLCNLLSRSESFETRFLWLIAPDCRNLGAVSSTSEVHQLIVHLAHFHAQPACCVKTPLLLHHRVVVSTRRTRNGAPWLIFLDTCA